MCREFARVKEQWVLVDAALVATAVVLPQNSSGGQCGKEPGHRCPHVLVSNIRDENINVVPFLRFQEGDTGENCGDFCSSLLLVPP